jgi:hypothetical protein
MNDHYLKLSLTDKQDYYLKAFPNADMEHVVLPSALEPAVRKVALARILAAAVLAAAAPAAPAAPAAAAAPDIQGEIIAPAPPAVAAGDGVMAEVVPEAVPAAVPAVAVQ